ncbi:general stress protein [Aneurinibacillus sp. BA2021]|nr:general stress protein [Aneurinibacillus sp. BA2021]
MEKTASYASKISCMFSHAAIFIIAHSDAKQDWLNLLAETNNIDSEELGLKDAILNAFRSEKDAVCTELMHLGLNEQQADKYEKELADGRVLLAVIERHDTSPGPFGEGSDMYTV